jgi:hypothetical protein
MGSENGRLSGRRRCGGEGIEARLAALFWSMDSLGRYSGRRGGESRVGRQGADREEGLLAGAQALVGWCETLCSSEQAGLLLHERGLLRQTVGIGSPFCNNGLILPTFADAAAADERLILPLATLAALF